MSKKLLIGFIAGAVAGAMAGILLAPGKGSNTRTKLAGKMKDCFKKVKRSLVLPGNNVNHTDEGASDWEQAERPYTASRAW